MEDASGIDLSQFRLWYSQAGTPQVRARLEHDAASATRPRCICRRPSRTRPGQSDKLPMVLPLKTALIGADSGATLGEEQLILLDEPRRQHDIRRHRRAALAFDQPRFLRARPARRRSRRPGELERLAEVDPNPFARYEALQELMYSALLAGARGGAGRSGAGHRGDARHAPVQCARPRVQGRGAVAAQRGPDRRPDGAGRSRMRSTTAAKRLRRAVGSALADDLARAQAMSRAGKRPVARSQGRPPAEVGGAGAARGRRSGTRRGPGQGPVRRRRQYDRPAGRADGAGQPRRAGARSRLRRILSSATRATAWCSTNGSRCRPRPSAPTRSTWSRRWPGIRSSVPATPTAGARLVSNFAANQWAFHHAFGPRLSLCYRHDPGGRPDQSAGRRPAGAVAGPLETVRARRAELMRARTGADCRNAGP